MALTKVSGGILDPGINVAGIVTATGFDGPFTGGSSRNITAGIITATELDINGNVDISGNLVVQGDTTTLNTTLRNVELLRVSAASTLPAGIITQTSTGDILNLYDGSTEVFSVADGGTVSVLATGDNKGLRVHTNSGVSATNNELRFNTGQSSGFTFMANSDGGASNERLKIDADGVATFSSATGINTGVKIQQTALNYSAGLEINATNGGQAALKLKASKSGTNRATRLDYFNQDSTDPKWTLINDWPQDGSNDFSIRYSNSNKIAINCTPDNQVELFHNHQKKFETVGYGVTVYGTTETQQLNVTGVSTGTIFKVPDATNVNGATNHIAVGDNSDLKLYHDNNGDAQIFNSTGHLTITNNTDGKIINLQPKSGANGIIARYEGAAELYYNNLLRLETDANGVQIKPNVGGVTQLGIAQTTTTAYSINGTISFINSSNTTAQIQGRTGSASTTGDILFLCNTVGDETLAVLEDGKVRIPDGGMFVAGSGNDLKISHSSTGSGADTIDSSSGYMYINSDALRLNSKTSAWNYLRGDKSDGVVKLYKSNSEKLATSDTGISVTGEVAASQDYPDLRPTLDLNFAAVKELDSRIVFYRNSTATSINEHGLVSYSGFNEPRFDHDVTTRQSKGLLIEPSIANWIRYSTNLSESGWGLNNTTTTLAPDVVAPDGTTGSVYENMENSSSSYHATYYSASIPVTNNQYYSISSWVKRGPNYRTDINNGDYQFYCSRGTGSVATVSISSDFKSIVSHSNTVDRSITLFPNDWVRVTYSFQSNQDNSSVTPHWLHGNGGTYLGNGTSSVYIWGCQFEQLTYPTSYVPTDQGNVVYRGSEQCVIDGTDFSDFYNPLESSVYVDGIMNVPSSYPGQYNILHIGDSNANGHGIFRENGTKDVWYHIRNNDSTPSGGNLNPSGFGDWDRGEEARIAVAFKDGDQAISVNGGNQVTATVTSSYPTANITKMWIGSAGDNGSGQFSGTIGRIMYYPKQLTDNQLNTLTA